ncbi:MAG: DUF58 domain-containing protein [Planctomycetaceae bacterium]
MNEPSIKPQIASKAQLTSLLDNDVLARLERMRLKPRRRLTNRSQGEHLAGKGGSSIEFSDYRDYAPGDDMRYVDWNVFSRLHRPYVKQYQYEEEMHVTILIDASSSMQYEDKFLRAKQMAAAFGLMGLLNVERVSVYSCNHTGQRPVFLPPCTGRANMSRLFEFLERLEAGGDFPVEQAVEAVLARHRGRGIAVVLSDFLTFGDLTRPLNLLYSAGLEVCAVQILGPSEIDPELTGDLRFVDSETGHTLDVSSVGDLLGIYHQHRLSLEEELAQHCRSRSGRFLAISARDSLSWVLFDLLRRRGWVQ